MINEGFVALAAPVFDHDGMLCAAMTVIGPSGLMDADLEGKSARVLKRAVNRLSRLMGFPVDRPPHRPYEEPLANPKMRQLRNGG